jgi:hypothetical protein
MAEAHRVSDDDLKDIAQREATGGPQPGEVYRHVPRSDLVGERFGRLMVVGKEKTDTELITRKKRCLCDCGREVFVDRASLRSGNTRSCGCLQKEAVSQRGWKGCGEISGIYWSRTTANAKARGLEIEITLEDAWELYIGQQRRCALSGLPIGFVRDARDRRIHQTASLDRIDSAKGYVAGNLQWVHKKINKMKTYFNEAEFVELCRAVAIHSSRKGCPDG